MDEGNGGRMRLVVMRGSGSLVARAQKMGGTVRAVVDALRSPRPEIALARQQFAAVRQAINDGERGRDDT